MDTSTKPLILQAFEGTNQTTPVWFMRQAGRYLPEYQQFKQKYSLDQMFQTPELVAEITCLPIDLIGVDAAILFADILTLPQSMGFDISFDNKKGPIIQLKDNFDHLHDFEDVPHIRESIRLTLEQLPKHIPLIGFAGAPFTVATYLIEGGSSINFTRTLKYIASEPEQFKKLMERLTDNTIRYLQLQIDAGISMFQLFDSWGGILRPAEYEKFVLPCVQRIFSALDCPSIYFLKNTHHLLKQMTLSGADLLSVDHTVSLQHDETILASNCGVQGNLYNGLLYADQATLAGEVEAVLKASTRYDRYIFNLSHGVFPDVNPDQLKRVVDQVHAFSR